MRSTNRLTSVAVAGTVLLALTACSSTDQTATEGGPLAAKKNDLQPATSQGPADETFGTMKVSGLLTKPYLKPSIEEFIKAWESGNSPRPVHDVVIGTVANAQSRVGGEPGSNEVTTDSTITVESSARRTNPSQVVVSEWGGVVPLRKVREDFEGKGQAPLTDEDLDKTVNYEVEGRTMSQRGQRVVVIMGPPTTDGSAPSARIRLVESDPGTFTWPGEKPNPNWPDTFTVADIQSWQKMVTD